MGFFRSNAEEKKLKELTGGFLLSPSFMNKLELNGLTNNDGLAIQRELKQNIKDKEITVESMEIRLNYLIKEKMKEKGIRTDLSQTNKKDNTNKHSTNSKQNILKTNQIKKNELNEENLQICPNCNKKSKKEYKICPYCFYNFEKETKNKAKNQIAIDAAINEIKKIVGNKKPSKYYNSLIPYNIKRWDTTKNILINEAKNGELLAKNVKSRFRELNNLEKNDTIKSGFEKANKTSSINTSRKKDKELPIKGLRKIEQKQMIYLLNQNYNKKSCPECKSECLDDDNYCYNCGKSISNYVKVNTTELSNLKNGDVFHVNDEGKIIIDENDITQKSNENSYQNPREEDISINSTNTPPAEELSELEAIYKKKVSLEYSSDFKFAYVIYLEDVNKHPTKTEFAQFYKFEYNTSIAKLKKQGQQDRFIKEGSAISAVKDSTVAEIKEILKEYKLKVSGRKQELIDRISENLSENEIRTAFPKKSFELTEEGKEFLENNPAILYYNTNSFIKMDISTNQYDSLFTDTEKTNNFYKILINHYKQKQDKSANEHKWGEYKRYLGIEADILEDYNKDKKIELKENELKENEDKLLKIYLKIFLAKLNNWEYDNQYYPEFINFSTYDLNPLIKILNKLSLELEDLKNRFHIASKEIKIPKLLISEEDSFKFLLKAFNGENPEELTEEIKSQFKKRGFKFN